MNGVIYKILNIKTNQFYIGSSINFHKRKLEHKNDLKKNIHHSTYMQRSYNKYGKNNFIFEILANCPEEYLKKLEQWFVDTLKPKYNIAKDVIRPQIGKKLSKERKLQISKLHFNNTYNLGRVAKEETRNKMSKTRLGKKLSDNAKLKLMKNCVNPVLQFDKSGNLIAEYDSIQKASRATNIPRQTISQVCRGEYSFGYGYSWKYKCLKQSNNKKIKDTTTGIIYNSIKECSEQLKIHRNSISNSLVGRIKSHKNLIYYNEDNI